MGITKRRFCPQAHGRHRTLARGRTPARLEKRAHRYATALSAKLTAHKRLRNPEKPALLSPKGRFGRLQERALYAFVAGNGTATTIPPMFYKGHQESLPRLGRCGCRRSCGRDA